MRNDDVRDLITQLNRLQLQQTELIIRLERATSNDFRLPGQTEQEHNRTGEFESESGSRGTEAHRTRTSEPEFQEPTGSTTLERKFQEPRVFSIGDYVAIKNPNLFSGK